MKIKKFFAYLLIMFFLSLSCGNSPDKKALELMELGMHDEAIELLKSEIANNPKNGDLHYTLAIIYIDLERGRSARTSIERAIQINKKYSKMIANVFWDKAIKKFDKKEFYVSNLNYS